MSTTTRLCGLAASALALTFAGAAGADRPSLLDLQATLDQVVTGLCNGDSTTCGVAAPAAAAGQLIFDPGGPDEAVLSLVELDLSIDPKLNCDNLNTCVPAGSTVLEDIRATVLSSEASGALLPALVTGTPFPVAHVVVPNPAGAGTVVALQLFNPLLEQLTHSSTPGHSELRFAATRVRFDWRSTTSEWNFASPGGAGCVVPITEAHVELSGNPTTQLQSGEIEAIYSFGANGVGIAAEPMLAVLRVPPNACHVRGAASVQRHEPRYDRLWSRDREVGGGRESVETVDIKDGWVDRWTLHVRSGVLSESIELIPLTGTIELRTFRANGTLESSTSVPFSF